MNKKKFSMEGVVIIVLLVMLVGVVLFSYYRGDHVVHLTGDSLVLTFIGILATFIVVGNAQQVREIRNDMRDELKEINNTINNNKQDIETSCNDQIKKVRANVKNLCEEQKEQKEQLVQAQKTIKENKSDINTKIEQIEDTLEKLSTTIVENIDKIEQLAIDTHKISQNIKELMFGILLLNVDDTSKLLIDLLFEEKPFYSVETEDGKTFHAVVSAGSTLQFIDTSTNDVIVNISKVNGLMYDSVCISKIYDSMINLNQKPQEVSILDVDSEIPNDIS